ncbi:MAG TPA: hypothetical protein VKT77_20885 [Chthonomonadaceae bacterium]|nr:hypothetical protein [Chthonomonadaceae bacterium]
MNEPMEQAGPGTLTRRALIGAALAAPLLAGCGGGMATARGAVAISLRFASIPANLKAISGKSVRKANRTNTKGRRLTFSRVAYAGNIPVGSRAVTVNIVNPATGASLAPQRIVTAPVDATGVIKPLVTVEFAALPAGPIRVVVAAFPSEDATGFPLATGSVSGTVPAGQTTTLNALMILTITKLSISPVSVLLSANDESQQIVATAVNAAGQVLDLPLLYISSDPDIADVDENSADPRRAIIAIGNAHGTTQVTVVEPNSELTAVVRVTYQ